MEHSLLFNLVEFDHDVLRPIAFPTWWPAISGLFSALTLSTFPKATQRPCLDNGLFSSSQNSKTCIRDLDISLTRRLGHCCFQPATSRGRYNETRLLGCMVIQSSRRQFDRR